MISYIIRRLLQSIVVLLLVSVIVFLGIRLLPGDPILLVLSQSDVGSFTEEEVEHLRHEYGLDKSYPEQYINWIKGLLHGDMGKSIITSASVADEIGRRLPITFHIGILAIILGAVVGIPIGVISAVKRGKWLDQVVITISNLGITMPNFLLAMILMYIFALHLQWLPVMGYTSPFEDLALNARQLVMPVICLAVFPMASMARQSRSSMLEVMQQDYIRTARAKGLSERTVIFTHALKNGLIPIITLLGMSIHLVVGGAVVIENIFNIPGMGRLLVSSVQNQDFAYVQGIIMIIAVVIILTNLLVEVLYAVLDPRIRLS